MVRLKVDGDGDLRQLPSKIDATTVLQALRSTTIPKNVDRKNIRKDSNVAVRSATFGALSRGNAPARVSEIARRRPILCELLARFGRSLLRDDFAFASIQLNVSYEAKMHVDASNDGPSAIIALGDFRGGELWCQDRGVLPCRGVLQEFNGNQPHCTLPLKGNRERYSLIFFSAAGHDRLPPTDAMDLEAMGFRLPRHRLTHTYMPDAFAAPHLESAPVHGYHQTLETRLRIAHEAFANWNEDWPGDSIDDRLQAFQARRKPGQDVADDVCFGLRLGCARLRSSKLRGDDNDAQGGEETVFAACPIGMRGPTAGVVMYHERSYAVDSTVHSTVQTAAPTYLDLFGVFYCDGRFEELELEELAMSLEPAPGESEAQSAPALARAHLSRFGKVYAAPEEPLRFVSAPETVEKRLAANRKVLDRVEALEGEPHTTTPLTPLDGDGLGDSYAPHRALLEAACRMVSTDTFFVDEMGCAAVSPDEIAHLLISVSRLVLRAYGGAETSNLLHFCRAAGLVWFKDARRQPDARLCLPIEWRGLDDCRVGAAFAVALEARLERLGFGSFAFAPSVNDVCLDDSDRNEKFDEFGPLPFMRERIVRVVLGVVCDGAAFFDDAQAMAESPALLASLERQLNDAPPSKWTSRYGHVVRVPTALCTQGGAEAERLAVRPGVASRTPSHFRNLGAVPATTTKAGDHVHKGPARPQDAGPAADGRAFHDGDVVGRRHHGAGVLYGTIVAFENQVGVPRYLISWSEGQDSWLAETQVRQLFVESSIESEVDNWPAQLIDPLVEIRTLKRQNGGGARFDGVSAKALQLWCRCAREGYTAWARERVVTRHVLLEDSCLRLAAPFLARPLTLAPNADCVAWQDTDETDGGAPTIIEGTTKEVLGTSPTRDEGTSLRPRDNAVALARAVVAAQRCAAAETLRRREALDDGLRDDKGHYRLSVNIEGLLDLSPRPRSTPPADASKRQRAAGDADDEWRRPEIQVEPAGRRDRSEPREAAAAVGGCLNRGGADAGDGCAAAVKRQKASELPATQPPTQKPEGPCSIYTMGLYM